jgi:hypothetical protein
MHVLLPPALADRVRLAPKIHIDYTLVLVERVYGVPLYSLKVYMVYVRFGVYVRWIDVVVVVGCHFPF